MRRVSTAVTGVVALAALLAGCGSDTPKSSSPTTTVGATVPGTLTTSGATASIAGTSTTATSTPAVAAYTKVGAPTVPDKTAPIDPTWVEPDSGTLGTDVTDGVYWGEVASVGESDSKFVSFDLSQALFGAACRETLGTGDDACNDDFGIVADPHGEFPAFVPDLATVTIVDVAQQNYAIDGTELWNLASKMPPSASAPAGFAYQPFPYLVTVKGGKVVGVQQVWTP